MLGPKLLLRELMDVGSKEKGKREGQRKRFLFIFRKYLREKII
jgi:hypothetical protein